MTILDTTATEFARGRRPVDLAHFCERVEGALLAFGEDAEYAVRMARSAVSIRNKREMWEQRRNAA